MKTNLWEKFYKLNIYYHRDIEILIKHLIPNDSSVIEFSSRGGEIIASLPNKTKAGVEEDVELLKLARRKSKNIIFLDKANAFKKLGNKKFGYIVLDHTLSEENDIGNLVDHLRKISDENTRIIVIYFNFLWKPVLDFAEAIGQKLPKTKEPNWLTDTDVDNFFNLAGFEKISCGKRFLFPFNLPIVAGIANNIFAHLPLVNTFCLTKYSIFRLHYQPKEYSTSLIIPARNEEGNIMGLIKKIPKLGKKTEIIFIEGNSRDNTFKAIKDEIKNYKGSHQVKLFKQKGVGKGDAVRLGFSKSKNEVLIVFDADLTVPPSDLIKFYNAITLGKGDLVIGSRLVYPMEKQAMRFLNYLGNRFFSIAFTFVLGQRIKDTLCGTKVILKSNYKRIEKNRKFFGDFDPFGDFDLIFGATKLNLKITEIPIRYKERTYGTTNISRFFHGILLIKMLYFAAKKLKFY